MKICRSHGRCKKSTMKCGVLIILLIVIACHVGCTSPIAINTMGAAGSNTPVAFGSEGGGRGESFWIAKYEDVMKAALSAGKALSLEIEEKRIEDDQTFIRFYDGKKERIDLFIERRTDTMTSIRFRVGWFGSVAFGRLLARQIMYEVTVAEYFLEDWTLMDQ